MAYSTQQPGHQKVRYLEGQLRWQQFDEKIEFQPSRVWSIANNFYQPIYVSGMVLIRFFFFLKTLFPF